MLLNWAALADKGATASSLAPPLQQLVVMRHVLLSTMRTPREERKNVHRSLRLILKSAPVSGATQISPKLERFLPGRAFSIQACRVARCLSSLCGALERKGKRRCPSSSGHTKNIYPPPVSLWSDALSLKELVKYRKHCVTAALCVNHNPIESTACLFCILTALTYPHL